MATYKHHRQHRFHSLRYGYRHWTWHQDGIRHPHKNRKKKRKKRSSVLQIPEKRFVLTVTGIAAGILLLLAAQAAYAVYNAYSQLSHAQSKIHAVLNAKNELLTPEGRAQAAQDILDIAQSAQGASQTLDSSIGLRVFGILPFVGTQIDGAKQLVSDVASFGHVGSGLIVAADQLAQASRGTTINLPLLANLRHQTTLAALYFKHLNRPNSSLIGPLGAARAKFNHVDAQVTSLLSNGAAGLSYAEQFLGVSGPRTYLLAGENQAEMRDQGAVLSFAILSTHDGHFSVSLAQSVGRLQLSHPAPIAIPAGTEQVFGNLFPTMVWQSTNATGDFATSGAFMTSMFHAATGYHVDGVIGLDVRTLESLLRLTGAVHVAGIHGSVDAGNVVNVLLYRLYKDNPTSSQVLRHDQIAAVAQAAVNKMNETHVDVASLAKQLAADAQRRDLLLYDAVPSNERLIARFGGSGQLAATHPNSTFHLAIESAVAAKLDYFVHSHAVMHVHVDSAGDAFISTTVTVVNDAPAGQAPSYQLGPDHVNSFHAGDFVTRTYLWSPRGAIVPGGVNESGLVLDGPRVATIPPQHEGQVSFQTVLYGAVHHGALTLHFVPQSNLHATTLTVVVEGGPNGHQQVSTVLDRDRSITLHP